MPIIDLLIAGLLLVMIWRKVIKPLTRTLVDGAVALYAMRWTTGESYQETLLSGLVEKAPDWVVLEYRNGKKRFLICAKSAILGNPWVRTLAPRYIAKQNGFDVGDKPYSVWTDYTLVSKPADNNGLEKKS